MYGLWEQFVSFVPTLVGAFVVFVFGWIVASVLGKAISKLAKAAQLFFSYFPGLANYSPDSLCLH